MLHMSQRCILSFGRNVLYYFGQALILLFSGFCYLLSVMVGLGSEYHISCLWSNMCMRLEPFQWVRCGYVIVKELKWSVLVKQGQNCHFRFFFFFNFLLYNYFLSWFQMGENGQSTQFLSMKVGRHGGSMDVNRSGSGWSIVDLDLNLMESIYLVTLGCNKDTNQAIKDMNMTVLLEILDMDKATAVLSMT